MNFAPVLISMLASAGAPAEPVTILFGQAPPPATATTKQYAFCQSPLDKDMPACNPANLDYFPISAYCPSLFVIVTGASGSCEQTLNMTVPHPVNFHGDDPSSWWKGPNVRRCRTPDQYSVQLGSSGSTFGVSSTSTILWQLRPWAESGRGLPRSLNPNDPWLEAQCSGFLQLKPYN